MAQSKKAQRREAAKAAQRRARTRRTIIWSVAALAGVALIAFLVFQPLPEALADVESFSNQGDRHLAEGDPVPAYNSNPGTSGDHAAAPAACGIYLQEVPDVVQIHNLEHGAVGIHYLPSLEQAEIERLHEFARTKNSHILVAPRADLSHPVVVTSWTRLLRLDSADVDTISLYYDNFAFTGPEVGVACPFTIDEAN